MSEREIFASFVELIHHLIADTIQNENEDKKTNAKALGLMKKNKRYQTSNHDISITAAWVELNFLQCVDLVQI